MPSPIPTRPLGGRRAAAAALIAAAAGAAPWLAAPPAAEAQPQGDTWLATRTVRVATFDCGRFTAESGSHAQKLNKAFEDSAGRPNPYVGRWVCKLQPGDHKPICYPTAGAQLVIAGPRQALAEFTVKGSCPVSITFPQASFVWTGPASVAARIDRSQILVWQVEQHDRRDDTQWRNTLDVVLRPAALKAKR